MKVMFFSSSGNMAGGAIICLKSIILHCIESGIEPFVVIRAHGRFEDFLRLNNVKYEVVGYHDWLRPKKDHHGIINEFRWIIKGAHNYLLEKKMFKIISREKPDVYHLNVIYNSCGAKSAHKLGVPVVWHIREFAEVDEDTPFFRNKKKAYNLISQSNCIVCVSDCIKEYYSRFILSCNLIRIYDGIEIPKEKATRHYLSDPVSITLSGGAKIKGHIDLIEAARIMQGKKKHKFIIRIAGRFVDRTYYEYLNKKVIEYNLNNCIQFIGHQDDMDEVWQATDIAVVCSRYESFGLSVCEAMARAIPAVCAKSTGSLEITSSGKFTPVYDIGNYIQLAHQIEDIMENYDHYADAALVISHIIRKQYSISESCAKLIDVFQNVSNHGNPI